MGIVFGMTGVEEPKYVLLQSKPFEIRSYPPYIVAEVKLNPSNPEDNSAFRVLAKYIGVFGNPENESQRQMSMTAPVTMVSKASAGSDGADSKVAEGEKMAMTAPVFRSNRYMGFVLPFEYVKLEDVPRPLDSRIELRAVPERIVACSTFSGYYSHEVGRNHFRHLKAQLLEAGLVENTSDVDEDMTWQSAQYHPPYTLPFMRRNEIWMDLNEAMPTVKSLLQKLRSVK
jgi:hypothetical protein